MNPFKYAARVFSNDPSASCSRILAVLCVAYVLIYGALYFSTLTSTQVQFLTCVLGGVLPFAFKKLTEYRTPPTDGQQ